jgi:hypothetical protein
MYYIGLDVHKKTISYCTKDVSGQVHQEGKIGATRCELDRWVKILPQPRTIAMQATLFTGWICDHLLPHAEQVKVAHPLMLRVYAKTASDQAIDRTRNSDFPNTCVTLTRPQYGLSCARNLVEIAHDAGDVSSGLSPWSS